MEGCALPVSTYRTCSAPQHPTVPKAAWARPGVESQFTGPIKSNLSRDLGGHVVLPYFTNEEAEADRGSEFMTPDF